MKKSLIFVGMLAIGFANAQEGNVGINTDQPKATLDIQPNATNLAGTTNEGILAPRLSKTRVANIETPVQGTLVYVLDENSTEYPNSLISDYAGMDSKVSKITEKGYYFYNGTEWVKVQYKDTDTNDTEWVYDAETKRINLKRSGQTTGFLSKVYYDAQTGQFVNQENESFVNNGITTNIVNKGIYELLQKSSNTLLPFISNDTPRRNYKSLQSNVFNVNESAVLESFRPSGVTNTLRLLDSNVSPSYWVTGTSTSVSKNDNTTTNYLMGGSNSIIVSNGNISGYATATRSEISVDSPTEITGEISSIRSFLSTGAKQTKSIKEMAGINSLITFGNSTDVETVKNKAVLYSGNFDYRTHDPKIPVLAGFYYGGISTTLSTLQRTEAHYGIYLADVDKAKTNYAIYSNSGKIRVGDLADTGATTDRVVTVDANGVLKTGGSIASNNGVQTQSGMTCTAENAGKINYTTIQKDGKDVGVFGFCMQKGTDYVWVYMLGGSNIYGTSANGAAFGQGL